MSLADYVVVYHTSGGTSIHSVSSWDFLMEVYLDPNERPIKIDNPWGGCTIVMRSNIDSIHLVTEAQVEMSSQRRAALDRADEEAKGWEG